jgi:hypothetical protein
MMKILVSFQFPNNGVENIQAKRMDCGLCAKQKEEKKRWYK